MGAGLPIASTRLHTNADINGIGGSEISTGWGRAKQDFSSLLSGSCRVAGSEDKQVRPAGAPHPISLLS